MNIFLPYENIPTLSIQALDDKRLLKQILEIRQILQVAEGASGGFKKHPITQHYLPYKAFLTYYGISCCLEYQSRFKKIHKCFEYFCKRYKLGWSNYIPFYAEGAKGSPNYIRTTENVSKLYQNKLRKKWNEDIAKGHPPKWTNRLPPDFYYKQCENENKIGGKNEK